MIISQNNAIRNNILVRLVSRANQFGTRNYPIDPRCYIIMIHSKKKGPPIEGWPEKTNQSFYLSALAGALSLASA